MLSAPCEAAAQVPDVKGQRPVAGSLLMTGPLVSGMRLDLTLVLPGIVVCAMYFGFLKATRRQTERFESSRRGAGSHRNYSV